MESVDQVSSGCFLDYANSDLPLVCDASEVENVHCMRGMLRTNIASESDVVDLFCCCFPRPFCSFYLIREADTWDCERELEVRKMLEALRIGWDSIDLFVVLPSRRGLVYAATPAF